MTQLVFYEKPGCISNRRQQQLLRRQGFALEVRDLLREAWSAERLRPFFGERPVAEWFNPSAPAIKQGEIDPSALSEAQALAAMVADPLLIRRPLVESPLGLLAGFTPDPLWQRLGVVLEEAEDLASCARSDEAQPLCPPPSPERQP